MSALNMQGYFCVPSFILPFVWNGPSGDQLTFMQINQYNGANCFTRNAHGGIAYTPIESFRLQATTAAYVVGRDVTVAFDSTNRTLQEAVAVSLASMNGDSILYDDNIKANAPAIRKFDVSKSRPNLKVVDGYQGAVGMYSVCQLFVTGTSSQQEFRYEGPESTELV